jgi:hypothetical protein
MKTIKIQPMIIKKYKDCSMKKISLLFVFLFVFVSISNLTYSQLLLSENFNYPNGDSLGAHGWQAFTNWANPIYVGTNNGLSYTGYVNSGIGNAAIIKGDGEDVYRSFTAQSTGNVYASFLVNVTIPRGDGNFFGLLTSSHNLLLRYLRAYAKAVTGGWSLGLGKSSEAPTYGATVLALNTTYLVVLKYAFVSGATNDIVTAYVFTNPTLPAVEPAVPEIGPLSPANTDPADIGCVVLRQDTTVAGAYTPDLVIDGIRVGNTWNDAPLPVELSSFTSNVNGRNIQLNWLTKTEKNSDKFVIEREAIGANWEAIGSVKAAVLSNSPKNYSYSDTKLQSGKYQYRLKMVDNDGSFTFSSIEAAEVAVPKDFVVSQNYPNPFNPSTKIDYQVPVDAKVILEVYNIAGQKVSELVNQEQSAGYYTVDFGASKLSSGVYIYRIVASDKATGNNFSSIKKMLLLK